MATGLRDARKELRIKSFLQEWGEDGPVVHAQTLAKVCGLRCVPVSSCLCVFLRPGPGPGPFEKCGCHRVWHTPLENNKGIHS